MARKKLIAENRKRAYRSLKDLPHNIQRCHELVYDICLELGVCPSCQARSLFRNDVTGHVYAKCLQCTIYQNEFQQERRKPKLKARRKAA
jgi:hypothetical protein